MKKSLTQIDFETNQQLNELREKKASSFQEDTILQMKDGDGSLLYIRSKQLTETAAERNRLKEENELLQKANDGLRTNLNLVHFQTRDFHALEKEKLRLSERLNASSEAYSQLKSLNSELLGALKEAINVLSGGNRMSKGDIYKLSMDLIAKASSKHPHRVSSNLDAGGTGHGDDSFSDADPGM